MKEGSASLLPFKFDILIPPRTQVLARWAQLEPSTVIVFGGRVYGVED